MAVVETAVVLTSKLWNGTFTFCFCNRLLNDLRYGGGRLCSCGRGGCAAHDEEYKEMWLKELSGPRGIEWNGTYVNDKIQEEFIYFRYRRPLWGQACDGRTKTDITKTAPTL